MNSFKQLSTLTLIGASFWLMAANPGDVTTELGLEMPKLRHDVLLNLKEEKWFFFNATSAMRQVAQRIPEGSRATTVRALGKTVRAYIESSVFRNEWRQDLRATYPYDETYTAEGIAQKKQENEAEKSAMKSQMGAQMAAMDQGFSQMDPAMLKMAAQSQIAQQEEELASLEGSERTMQAQRVASLKKMLALAPAEFKKQYLASLKQQMQAKANESVTSPELDKGRLAEERKKKAEFDAHADFKPLLKKRLQDFIALSESVDFDARLVPMGRKQAFANPVYERKCAEWKFLYRLGKEPVAEAQLFARQWLTDLSK
ncbi:hypothetical protein [Spirosoma validum]|uniref:DUF3106 domain-containing protein n=1 Tax=Spirosoma validum TaxID=2771355 RepID=A0A927B1R1_9BACT|nr:hypothetical protein [Spirosoma validum]MBD2753642.1 hypothetical protein [Spirosoma validum]